MMIRLFITERKGNIHWNVPSRVEASKAALKQLPASPRKNRRTIRPAANNHTERRDPSVLNPVQISS